MNIEDLEILKELSEQTYFGDLPFLYYADLIDKLLTAYEKEKETSHYNQSQLDIANAKLVEEKEKNKDREFLISENRKLNNYLEQKNKIIEEYKKDYISRYTIEYLLDDYIHKDKIKAKIEEVEKELNKLLQKEEWLEPHDTTKRNKYMHYIEFGQSLLEKE